MFSSKYCKIFKNQFFLWNTSGGCYSTISGQYSLSTPLPVKTLENQKFSDVFRRYEKGALACDNLM